MLNLILCITVGSVSHSNHNVIGRHFTFDLRQIRRITRDIGTLNSISFFVLIAFAVGFRSLAAASKLIVDCQRIGVSRIVNDKLVAACFHLESNRRIGRCKARNRLGHIFQHLTDLRRTTHVCSDLVFSAIFVMVNHIFTRFRRIVREQNQSVIRIPLGGIFKIPLISVNICIQLCWGQAYQLALFNIIELHIFDTDRLLLQIHKPDGIRGIGDLVIDKDDIRIISGSRLGLGPCPITRNRLSIEHPGTGGQVLLHLRVHTLQRFAVRVHISSSRCPRRSLCIHKDNNLIIAFDLDRLAGLIRGITIHRRCVDRHIFARSNGATLIRTFTNRLSFSILGLDGIRALAAEAPLGIQSHVGHDLLFCHKGGPEILIGIPTNKGVAFTFVPVGGIGHFHFFALENRLRRHIFVAVGHKRNSIGRLLPYSIHLQIVGRHGIFPVDHGLTRGIQSPADKLIVTFHIGRTPRNTLRFGISKLGFVLEVRIRYASAVLERNGVGIAGVPKPKISAARLLPIRPSKAGNRLLVFIAQGNTAAYSEFGVFLPVTIQPFYIIDNGLAITRRVSLVHVEIFRRHVCEQGVLCVRLVLRTPATVLTGLFPLFRNIFTINSCNAEFLFFLPTGEKLINKESDRKGLAVKVDVAHRTAVSLDGRITVNGGLCLEACNFQAFRHPSIIKTAAVRNLLAYSSGSRIAIQVIIPVSQISPPVHNRIRSLIIGFPLSLDCNILGRHVFEVVLPTSKCIAEFGGVIRGLDLRTELVADRCNIATTVGIPGQHIVVAGIIHFHFGGTICSNSQLRNCPFGKAFILFLGSSRQRTRSTGKRFRVLERILVVLYILQIAANCIFDLITGIGDNFLLIFGD